MKSTPKPTQPELPFPKLCECGCGQAVKKPSHRFLHGHNMQSELPLPEAPNPSGLCMCGCGQPAPIATRNRVDRGQIKGQPIRYIQDHSNRRDFPPVPPNLSGLCMCGCGQRTPIAKRKNSKLGHIPGQPVYFISGHQARGRLGEPLEIRFWKCVLKTDTCWLWMAGKTFGGYGTIHGNGRLLRAHRVSYELHYGPIPEGMEVCHECDNPPCVNPAHLFLGTHQDNMHDMSAKGRGNKTSATAAKGEKHGMVKLTEDQVLAIRAEYATGATSHKKLATKFGVNKRTVSFIVRRQHWKHI